MNQGEGQNGSYFDTLTRCKRLLRSVNASQRTAFASGDSSRRSFIRLPWLTLIPRLGSRKGTSRLKLRALTAAPDISLSHKRPQRTLTPLAATSRRADPHQSRLERKTPAASVWGMCATPPFLTSHSRSTHIPVLLVRLRHPRTRRRRGSHLLLHVVSTTDDVGAKGLRIVRL